MYAFFAYAFYYFNILAHHLRLFWYKFYPARQGPDKVQSYPCRPSLSIRYVSTPRAMSPFLLTARKRAARRHSLTVSSIFFPPAHASVPAKLPTLFTIHGGGFIVGNPEGTDAWNHDFAHRHSVLVVALAYRKAPVWPFPCAIHDIEALLLAVLADTSLPIDASRVAMLGWSAGGNLALSVASLPSIHGSNSGNHPRVHAVIPVYPVIDFTVSGASKLRARQYKPLPGLRGTKTDLLLPVSLVFNWAYLRGVQDVPGILRNPLLSPSFVPREQLPPFVFFIGCELDMLAMESLRKASQLAGRPPPDDDAVVGRSDIGTPGELILDDERFSFETRTENSSYRWLLVPDVAHAFDQSSTTASDARQKRDQCQAAISDWLFAGPFARK